MVQRIVKIVITIISSIRVNAVFFEVCFLSIHKNKISNIFTDGNIFKKKMSIYFYIKKNELSSFFYIHIPSLSTLISYKRVLSFLSIDSSLLQL